MQVALLLLSWLALSVIASGQIPDTQGSITRRDGIRGARQFQLNSQYTEGNTYEIMSVALLATLGSFILPSLSTFLTYMVTSNRNLFFNKGRQRRARPQRLAKKLNK